MQEACYRCNRVAELLQHVPSVKVRKLQENDKDGIHKILEITIIEVNPKEGIQPSELRQKQEIPHHRRF